METASHLGNPPQPDYNNDLPPYPDGLPRVQNSGYDERYEPRRHDKCLLPRLSPKISNQSGNNGTGGRPLPLYSDNSASANQNIAWSE